MKAEHLVKGEQAEQLVERHLTKAGLTILQRNFRSRFGEIDLIGQHKKELVFIEVRFRSSSQFGSAAETVTIAKQRKLIKAAQFFLTKHTRLQNCFMRFDVVGVDANHQIEWIKGAFQSTS